MNTLTPEQVTLATNIIINELTETKRRLGNLAIEMRRQGHPAKALELAFEALLIARLDLKKSLEVGN